ncbi:hypothetical protein VTL71DRAFT_12933 [Oculimacula yallundae]|uniref:Uncharacterized protein n=1 Tax=Oculimacula yallundae TaxID=86028 RepID=A0ABR4CPN5_9HELO
MATSSSFISKRTEIKLFNTIMIIMFLYSLFQASTSLIKLCMLPYISASGPSAFPITQNTWFLVWWLSSFAERDLQLWKRGIACEAAIDVLCVLVYPILICITYDCVWGSIGGYHQEEILAEEKACATDLEGAEKGEVGRNEKAGDTTI